MPIEDEPLAARMRPRTLDEFAGQEHLLGARLRAAHGDRVGRAALDDPLRAARHGKTTLARLAAAHAGAAFEEESAVQAGRAEVRAVIERARERRRSDERAPEPIFFLDEIHRFNKAQQDALLPAVEEGLVTLIGATTENPYFEVNSALLSRSQIYELLPLSQEQVADAAAPRAARPRARPRRSARRSRTRRSSSSRRARAATRAPPTTRSSSRRETARRARRAR